MVIKEEDLNGFATIYRYSFSIDKVTKLSTLQMVDAEMDTSHPLVTRSHVGPHAGQSLPDQRRYSAV